MSLVVFVFLLVLVTLGLILLFGHVYRTTGGRVAISPEQGPSGPTGDPRCGRCGYIVRGIPSLQCPECGADLREVGIDVGRRRGRVPGPMAHWLTVVGLAAVLGVGLLILGSWIDDATRYVVVGDRVTTYTVTLARPTSGAYVQLAVDAAGTRPAGRPTGVLPPPLAPGFDAPQATLALRGADGPLGTLVVDLAADTHVHVRPDGSRAAARSGFGPAAVAAWIAACTGRSGPAVSAEAADVALLVLTPPRDHYGSALAAGGGGGGGSGSFNSGNDHESGNWSRSGLANFGSATGSYRSDVRAQTWRPAGIAAGGIALWFAGVWWIARRFGPGRRAA